MSLVVDVLVGDVVVWKYLWSDRRPPKTPNTPQPTSPIVPMCVYRPIVLIILSPQSESTWSPRAASSLFPTGFNGCSHESLEGKAELEVACGGSVAATWRRCAGSFQAGSDVRAGEHLPTCLPACQKKLGGEASSGQTIDLLLDVLACWPRLPLGCW